MAHPFKTAPVRTLFQEHELHFHLYLHHIGSGSNPNQITVVDTEAAPRFGTIDVNDWTIYDGLGPNANLVAHAQGLHCQASMEDKGWYNSFNIVFEDAWFKGSTLQVMGSIVSYGDSAIVGGTGEFTMARGVIYKEVKENTSGGNIIELDIHAIYTPMKKPCNMTDGNAWTL